MKKYVLKKGVRSESSPAFAIDYEKALNPSQYAAVTCCEGPVLVIAGAGTGKTRTLVYRVARLVDSGVPPHSILLLTFTRKAAREMIRRASLLLDGRCEEVAGGTFHSVGNTILRRFGQPIGVDPSFTILDRSDSEDLIALLRTTLSLHEKDKRFPKKGTIADIFSKSVNKMVPLEEVVWREYPHFAEQCDDLTRLFRTYAAYKRQKFLLDYDDLLVRLKELLENREEVRTLLSETYRYILVDEYQDTNKIQAAIIRLLACTHSNVMVVGDDSQSIYSFRGANFRNIMDFPRQFPGTQIFTLEENYRSAQPILTLANTIIEGAREKYTKHLFTHKKTGPLPTLFPVETEQQQSRFVCDTVLTLREEGIPLGEIAVLFRSSFHSFDLEIELSKCGISFVKRGGLRLVETAHVKDLIAHLRVLSNPRDAISWNRILLLIDGIGPAASHSLISAMGPHGDWREAFQKIPPRMGYREGILRLSLILERLATDTLSPAEQIGILAEYYSPLLREKYDDYPKRLRDLEHIQTIAERYRSREGFLSDIALEPPEEGVSGLSPLDSDPERLVLSTVHSAKGLEWHTVFIIWVLEGWFPIIHAEAPEEEMEEERRLFYVAVTRAKENLFLTYPMMVSGRVNRMPGRVLMKPSRFIEGIPPEILEPGLLVEE